MRSRLLAVVVLAAVGLSAQQPPTAPVVFRAAVDYVEVDATVTDARGNAVSDLTQSDFEVLEDGKPQTIASFTRVDLPMQRPAPAVSSTTLASGNPPILPDVQSNAPIEGGIYLIVLDDLHTGFERTAKVREIARQFIERAVGPNDVAAVVYTGHNDRNQDFTGNPQLLLAAVDKFVGDKLRPATLVMLEGVRQKPGPAAGANPPLELGEDVVKDVRAYRARSVMGSIRQLSEFMAGIRGRRKAMVLFGEGIDYDVDKAIGTEGSTAAVVRDETRVAIASAQRGNVTIYSVDPRGQFDPVNELIQTAGQFNRDSPGMDPRVRDTIELNNRGFGRRPPPTEANGETIQKEVRIQQDSLKVLAQETGGFATLNTNNFLRPFERIIRENSSYYLIGYNSTNDQRDGRQRTLQVRVKRPGLTVRARNGYKALESGASVSPAAGDTAASPALEALGSPLPVSGVPMRVFAAPFKGPKDHATVTFAIELDPTAFNFTSKDGRWIESLEMATTVVPAGGAPRPGDHSKKELALLPALYEAVKSRGARIIGQTELPPGRYQLRVAAGTNGGRAGSTVYDLEVPDYSSAPLMVSGLVLSSDVSLQTPTMPIRTEAPSFPNGPPAATRSFAQRDQLMVFGEVYDNTRADAAREVTITTTLRNSSAAVVRTGTSRGSSPGSEVRAVHRFSTRLSLANLAPGPYVLRVEARSDTADRPSASRDVQIAVTAP